MTDVADSEVAQSVRFMIPADERWRSLVFVKEIRIAGHVPGYPLARVNAPLDSRGLGHPYRGHRSFNLEHDRAAMGE